MNGKTDTKPRRLGIFGGTFDPPHNAHIRAACAFLAEAELDALYIMPVGIRPHNLPQAESDPALRLAMVRAAFDGISPRISVSDYEIRTPGVSYTYRTLTHFALTTDCELFFLCGADVFLTLGRWRHSEQIFARAAIACVMREDDPAAYKVVRDKALLYKEKYKARTMMIHSDPLELSSSEVRQILREGGDVSALVPPGVLRILDAYHLYRSE